MHGFRLTTFLVGASLAGAASLAAQSVSPQSGAASADANTSGNVVTFTVTNDFPSRKTFTLQCGKSGQVTACFTSSKVTLNGGASANVNVTFSTGAAGSGTATLTTFDGLFEGDMGTYNITVDAPVSYGVSVTPDGGSLTTASGSSGVTTSFTVTNTGNVIDWYNLSCARTGQVSSCSVQGSVGVNPGAGASVTVTYATSSVPGSGTLTLSATSQADPTENDGGSYTVTVPVVYGVNTTPDGGSKTAWTGSSGNTAAFTVTNSGNATDTYSFTCSRTGQVSSCSAPGNVMLAAGASTSVTGTFTASLMGSGTLTVTATSLGSGSVSNAGSYNVTVQSAASSTSPSPGTMTVDPNTSGNTATFTVTNNGNVTDSYSFQCTPGVQVTACTPPGITSIAAGANANVNVTFSTGAGGSGTVSMDATSMATAESSNGSYNVTVRLYQVAVTPDGGSLTTASGSTASATFTVQNTGNVSNTFSFTCGKASPVLTCTNPAAVTLAAGASTTRAVTYTTGDAGTGTVTLTASGSGASNQGSFNVTVPVVYGVDATPDGGSVTAWAGSTGNGTSFTITNTGNASDSFSFGCARTGEATTCTTPANVTLGPGAGTSVTSNFNASTSGGSGTVTVTATSLGSGSTSNAGSYNVTVESAVPSVAPVTDSITVDPNTSGNTATFTVTNTGTSSDAFSFECPFTGQVTACTAPSVTTIAAGASTNLNVTFSTGTGGPGSVTLDATSMATLASGSGATQVKVRLYLVAVTPDGGALSTPSTPGNVATFTVQNTGNVSNTFTFTCGYSGVVTGCTAPSSVTLAEGASATRTVTFPTAGPDTGTVTLTATGFSTTDQGSFNVTVPVVQAVAVTPEQSTDSLARNANAAVYYRVRNVGNAEATYTLSCSVSSLLTCNWTNPLTTITLQANQDSLVWASVTAGATTGSATVTLAASGPSSDSTTQQLEVYQPPVLALRYTHDEKLERSACVTAGAGPNGMIQCGDLVYAHGIPGYRSMNRLRAPTLLYNSGVAYNRPVVAVDYTTFASDPVPDLLRLQVKRVSDQTIVSDVYFSTTGFSGSVTETHRLSVPIALPTGAHDIDVILTPRVAGTWQSPHVASTRVLTIDGTDSPFGAGWWLAGVHRLVVQPDGSLLVVNPHGSPLFFEKNGTSFDAPPGEYSTVTQAGTSYRRLLRGGRVSIWYGATGLVDSVVDNNPTRNKATYTWSAGGVFGSTLSSITDPTGQSVTFAYDANGRLTQITVPAVGTVQVFQSQDAATTAWNVDSIVDPDGFVTRFTYGTASRMASSTARGTGTVSYLYDAIHRVDSVTAPAGVSAPAVQYRAWQLVGAPAAGTGTETNPATPALTGDVRIIVSRWRGASGQFQDSAFFRIDRFEQPVDINLPALNSTIIDRDSVGQPVRIARGGGGSGEVLQTWDGNGNLIRSITRRISDTWDTTRYEYDPVWLTVTKIVAPERDSVTFGYDGYGRRIWARDALGRQTDFFHTSRGQLDRIVEPDENVATTYTYDQVTFNLTAVADSVGSATYVYDATNNSDVVTVRNALGNETRYQYDTMKRPRFVTQVGTESATIEYQYDDVNRIRTQIEPRGQVSTWTSDAAGRLVERCVRVNWCETTAYEDGVNPTKVVTRDGSWILQEYDGAGNMTRRKLGVFGEDDDIQFTYDGNGNLTAVYNRYALIHRLYDWYGRVTYEREAIRTWNDSTVFRGTEIRYAYNRNGRRSRTWIGDPVAWFQACAPVPDGPPCDSDWYPVFTDSIIHTYDDVGNLYRISNTYWAPTAGAGNRTWTYLYDSKNRPTELRYPRSTGGTLNVYRAYDNDDRVRRHWSDATVGLDETITWNEAGQAIILALWGGARTDVFTYDALGRLLTIGGTHETNSYTYDAGGNRLTSTSASMVYNSKGQITSKTSGSCTTTYDYDNNGNQIRQLPQCSSVEDRTMTYDIGNRMTSTTTDHWNGSAQVIDVRTFWYDGLGRRILMRSDSTTAPDLGVWRYFWFGDNVGVKTFNGVDSVFVDLWWPSIQREGSGGLEGRGEWFFYGPGVDNLLGSWNYYEVDPAPRHMFFRDWRGSVVKVTNEAGTSLGLSPSSYAAFGTPEGTTTDDQARNPGYNGHESAGGLVYMRNRWYDPNTGRFTQEDPIGYAGGSNLYAYAGNDPILYSDPFGLEADTVDFADDDAKSRTEECVQKSKTCAELFTALDNHASKWIIGTGSLPPPNPGLTNTNAVSNQVFGGKITIAPSNFGAAQRFLGVPVNNTSVVTHELGHAVGNISIANMGSLSRTNNCDESCAIAAENAARGALGIALRR